MYVRGRTKPQQRRPASGALIRFLINIDMIGDDNPSLYAEFSDAGKAFIPFAVRGVLKDFVLSL